MQKSTGGGPKEYGGCSSVVTLFFEEILVPNWPVCWNIVVKEKPTAGSQFFGAFSSDRIPRATKDIKVLLT